MLVNYTADEEASWYDGLIDFTVDLTELAMEFILK